MPRVSTITQANVDVICASLLEQGKIPTLRLIIAEHGSGSQSTVQPLLKDWQRRRQAETPPAPENVLSPEVVKVLSKQFARDVQLALADLKDKLEISEEANGDLARENSAIQALLRQREAELAALSDQDAALRGQAVLLESDLARARSDYEAERQARIDRERQAAVLTIQLDELRERFNQVSEDARQSLAREQQRHEDLSAMRVAAGVKDALLDALRESVGKLETELAHTRQAESAAQQATAELRGQLSNFGR